jgi:histone-lysine N-methyltransferase SETD3
MAGRQGGRASTTIGRPTPFPTRGTPTRHHPIRPIGALFGGGNNSSGSTTPSPKQNWLEGLFGGGATAAPAAPAPPAPRPIADAPFIDFLARDLGVAVDQQPTVLAETSWGGRGLVAARPVAKGDLAAFVPLRGAAITAGGAASESPLLRRAGVGGDNSKQSGLTADLPDWTALAVWLMEQRHALENGDKAGRWAAYISRLPPPNSIGTVLEWGGGEAAVARDLAGSGLRHKAAEILRAADLTWREVEALAGAVAGGGSRGPYTRPQLNWALSVLLSRVVRLDSAPGQPSALVPWCDFLNHSPGAACYLDVDEWRPRRSGPAAASASAAVVPVVGVRADRAYKPGEEVFISYGPKSSGELLLSYGFCPPPQSNAHNDRAFIQVAVPASAAAKRRALTKRGIPFVETFALRADALPEGLLPYVAFADAELNGDEDDDAAAEALASALFGGGVGGEDDDEGPAAAPQTTDTGLPSAELEMLAWRGVAARCRAALADYTTDEQHDRALVASAPQVRERGASASDPTERAAALAEVRLRERRILAAAMFAATGQAKKSGGGGGRRR